MIDIVHVTKVLASWSERVLKLPFTVYDTPHLSSPRPRRPARLLPGTWNLLPSVEPGRTLDLGTWAPPDARAGTRNLGPKLKKKIGARAARRQKRNLEPAHTGGAEPEPRNPVPGRTVSIAQAAHHRRPSPNT